MSSVNHSMDTESAPWTLSQPLHRSASSVRSCSLSVASSAGIRLAGISYTAMALSDTVSKIDSLRDDQRTCIENCNAAAEVCEWCADECLGSEEMEACARLCRDVADLTALHARLMARSSSYSSQLAAICADACEACADECERHDADHCQVCAEVLRECADSCRSMASS